MEVVVGMTIMSIFMVMFTGSVLSMYRSANKAESATNSATQVNQAFLALDKIVRYAAAISSPGTGAATGDWYVELRTTNTGSEVCTQLRVHPASTQLQQRTWTVTSSGTSTPSAWDPLASGISVAATASGTAVTPFVLVTPTATGKVQQLTVNLASTSGSGSTKTTSSSTFSFAAVNSTLPPPTTPICQAAGRP